MRLFEAILDANHRAVAGDTSAGVRPAEFAESLPVIALTCVDPRLNPLFPNVLGLPPEQFIWLRNAGNLITGTLSSTLRSLALACAVKGGREIAIIGHTDCQVARTTTQVLLEHLLALGVERSRLPENLSEFFGTFGSERQNVIKACTFVRNSPLIGPKIPVHGLMIDVESGRLDWVVNGYETPVTTIELPRSSLDFAALGAAGSFKDFEMGEMKFPETKIGEASVQLPQVHPAPAPHPAAPPPEPPALTAAQVAQYAARNWPKPSAPPLPPLKKKPVAPPPIRPRSTLQ